VPLSPPLIPHTIAHNITFPRPALYRKICDILLAVAILCKGQPTNTDTGGTAPQRANPTQTADAHPSRPMLTPRGGGGGSRVSLYKMLFRFKALLSESNNSFITPPPHLQSLPHCSTIARPLRNIRPPPPTSPFVCHKPYNIGDGKISYKCQLGLRGKP